VTARRVPPDVLVAAGLAVAAFLFFWPLFVPGAGRQYLAEGDFIDQFYAFASFQARELAAGRAPLWNPFAYAGSPFWADVQAAVAYPPSLAVTLAAALALGRLPLAALQTLAVAHVALAAVFTYAFARDVLRSRWAAALAAIAFACGGYLTGYPLLQLAVLESNAWLPAALLGVRRIARRPAGGGAAARAPGALLLALAVGMAVLAGHPQSALYLLYAVLAYAAWLLWPWRGAPSRTWAALALGMLGGAALSAAGWLPALQYLRLSNRAVADYAALAHGFPPRELLGLALPGLTLWSPLYVGVVPLLLAVAALARHGRRPAAPDGAGFWGALGGAALLVSLGGHAFAFDLLYLAAPGFDLFRSQERAAFLVSFSLAMLAGHGAVAWRGREPATRRIVARGAAALTAAGALLAVLAAPGLRGPAVHLAVWSGAAALALGVALLRPRLERVVAPALLVLCLADAYVANARVNLQPGVPGEVTVTPLVEALPRGGPHRVHNEDRLPRNFGVLHGVRSTFGASPLRPRTYDALFEALRQANEPRLLQLTATSHVITPRPRLAGALRTTSFDDGATYLHALPPFPVAWGAERAEVVPETEAAIARLAQPSFDPRRTVLLAAAAGLPADEGGAGLAAEVVEWAPGRLLLRAAGAEGGWLVLSEVHYPGWRASLNGRAVPLARANAAFMATYVPPGEHELLLTFGAPWARAGLAISLLAALTLLAAAARLAGVAVGRRTAFVVVLTAAVPLSSACAARPDPAGATAPPPAVAPTLAGAGHPGSSARQGTAAPGRDSAAPWARALPFVAKAGGPAGAPTAGGDAVGGDGAPPDAAAGASEAVAGDGCPPGIARPHGPLLALYGEPFAFFGINVPYLTDPALPPERIEPLLADLAARGVNTVRLWFFHHHDPERLQTILDLGARHGVRFVVVLGDNVFRGRDWFFGEEDESLYRPHLQRTVERFAARPEILLWEVVNEPNCGGAYDEDCLKTIRDWLTMASRMVKAADPCHPVSSGMIGAGNYEEERDAYRRIHRRDTLDVLSVHRRSTEERPAESRIALELVKPLMVGEVHDIAYDEACQPLDGGAELRRRADRVEDDLRRSLAAGVAGYLLWDYAAGSFQVDGTARHFCGQHGFERDDPLWSRLAAAGVVPPVPWQP